MNIVNIFDLAKKDWSGPNCYIVKKPSQAQANAVLNISKEELAYVCSITEASDVHFNTRVADDETYAMLILRYI